MPESRRAFMLAGLFQPAGEETERVVPKGVELNRLATPRGHDPIAHFRVHPRELVTFFALGEQTIGRIDMNVEACAAKVVFGNIDQTRQKKFESVAIFRALQIARECMKEPEGRVGGVIFALLRSIREHVRD